MRAGRSFILLLLVSLSALIFAVHFYSGWTTQNAGDLPREFIIVPKDQQLIHSHHIESVSAGTTSAPLPKRKHIALIKTHKCASSTIQNILLRFGQENNLQFVLPKSNLRSDFQLGWPDPFDPAKHSHESKQIPDILCLHSVFSRKMVDFMPNDTYYVTSVRDPFTQLKSMYSYYNIYGRSKKPLSKMVTDVTSSADRSQRYNGVFVSNPLLRDLGLSTDQLLNNSTIDDYLTYLDSKFNLVMVVERFDESLIILRDQLHWSNSDILYFAKNFHQDQSRHSTSLPGMDLDDTPKNREKVYQLSPGDTRLYRKFHRKLETIIEGNKSYYEAEVEKLRAARERWMEFCVDKSVPSGNVSDRRFQQWGQGSHSYVLTARGLKNQTCVHLATIEAPFVRNLVKSQFGSES